MLNLSYKKSKEILTNNYTITLLLDELRKKSLLKRTFKDIFVLILCCLMILFLSMIIVLSQKKLIFIMSTISFVSVTFTIISIFILVPVVIISRNWIFETIVANILELVNLINAFIMLLLFIYFSIVNKMSLSNLMIFYSICLLIVILFVTTVYKNYLSFYKKINGNIQNKLSLDQVDIWLRNFVKYSGFLLFIVFTFNFIKRMMIKHFSINYRSLQYTFYSFVMIPVLTFMGLYLIFIYAPLKIFLPLYYLYKYQSEYEAEYHVSFGRQKRMK